MKDLAKKTLKRLEALEKKTDKLKENLPPDLPLSPGLYRELNSYFFNEDEC
jgi:hypothetical protein